MADGTEGAEKVTRAKATPKFHVFRRTPIETEAEQIQALLNEGRLWISETPEGAVKAPSKKEAIRGLTSDEDAEGTFFVIKENEYKPLTRKIERKVEDAWA